MNKEVYGSNYPDFDDRKSKYLPDSKSLFLCSKLNGDLLIVFLKNTGEFRFGLFNELEAKSIINTSNRPINDISIQKSLQYLNDVVELSSILLKPYKKHFPKVFLKSHDNISKRKFEQFLYNKENSNPVRELGYNLHTIDDYTNNSLILEFKSK